MKRIIIVFFTILVFYSCKDEVHFTNIKDPEKYVTDLSDSVVLKNVEKRDVNGDDLLDMEILVLTGADVYVTFYFINNGNDAYDQVSMEQFFGYESVEDEQENLSDNGYLNIEDFYNESDDATHTIIKEAYLDINKDGHKDAVAVTHYYSEMDGVYESYDAAIFYGTEDARFVHQQSVELSVLKQRKSDYKFKDLVAMGNSILFELENPSTKQMITFKYASEIGNVKLASLATISYDSLRNPLEKIIVESDVFGTVLFSDFNPNLLIPENEITVSNSKELIDALGNDRVIYLNEGDYYLNNIENYAPSALENLKNIEVPNYQQGTFFEGDLYNLRGGNPEDEPFGTYIEVTFKNLENVSFIGKGNVRLIVTNELIAVIGFENCKNITLDSLYLVHEVGGICSANVVSLYNCETFTITNSTLDGSGDIGIYAQNSTNINLKQTDITNCNNAAVNLYESDIMIEDGRISNNDAYRALIDVVTSSTAVLNRVIISNNKPIGYADEGTTAVFYVDETSSARLYNSCVIKDNKNMSLNNGDGAVAYGDTLFN